MQEEHTQLLDPKQLAKWIDERDCIWQMNFMSPNELARFAKDRGVDFSSEYIEHLWTLGLLRADLIIADTLLNRRGLVIVGKNPPNSFVYADARLPIRRKRGWPNAAHRCKAIPTGVQLLFHPFRFYVLYHLQRILGLHIVPMQMLLSTRGFPRLTRIIVSSFKRWSSSFSAVERILAWNDVVGLAVATEPFTYRKIFHKIHMPINVDLSTQEKAISDHKQEVLQLYRAIPLDRLEKARLSLTCDAAILDGNRDVHMMMRLSSGTLRLGTKGRLGGATYLLTMSEMLRRATEAAHDILLPEEDELGFGMVPPNLKKRVYGSNRLFDGSRSAAREFMRQVGLDYRTRLRWYVEGDTELGALRAVFDEREGEVVQVVNLKGRFGRRPEAELRNALRADLRDGTFSLVSMDKDSVDNIRVLKLAAERDEICGRFFLHDPDFEFGNFELREIVEVLRALAIKLDDVTIDPGELMKKLSAVKSAKVLFEIVNRDFHLKKTKKDQVWGAALMRYALENPIMSNSVKRPILNAIETGLRSSSFNYQVTRQEYRVDPGNGQLIERKGVESINGKRA